MTPENAITRILISAVDIFVILYLATPQFLILIRYIPLGVKYHEHMFVENYFLILNHTLSYFHIPVETFHQNLIPLNNKVINVHVFLPNDEESYYVKMKNILMMEPNGTYWKAELRNE